MILNELIDYLQEIKDNYGGNMKVVFTAMTGISYNSIRSEHLEGLVAFNKNPISSKSEITERDILYKGKL